MAERKIPVAQWYDEIEALGREIWEALPAEQRERHQIDRTRLSQGAQCVCTCGTLAVKADRDQKWGKYGPAIERWATLVGPSPSPTEPNTKGNPRLAAAFSEWMMGWPRGWVTDIPGLKRNDQLRIVGNGVCPQQAHAALLELFEHVPMLYLTSSSNTHQKKGTTP